jgi:hypothetical protein
MPAEIERSHASASARVVPGFKRPMAPSHHASRWPIALFAPRMSASEQRGIATS